MNNERRKELKEVKEMIQKSIEAIDEMFYERSIYNWVKHSCDYLMNIWHEENDASDRDKNGPFKSTNLYNCDVISKAIDELNNIIEDFDITDDCFSQLDNTDIVKYLEAAIDFLEEIK